MKKMIFFSTILIFLVYLLLIHKSDNDYRTFEWVKVCESRASVTAFPQRARALINYLLHRELTKKPKPCRGLRAAAPAQRWGGEGGLMQAPLDKAGLQPRHRASLGKCPLVSKSIITTFGRTIADITPHL